MKYSANITDDNGIKRTVSVNTEDSIDAVKNDYSEVIKKYNPDVVTFSRIRPEAGEAMRFKVTVNAPSHYLTSGDDKDPKPCRSMTATIAVKMGYPLVKVEAFYAPDHFLASPNVFTSTPGKACIDTWYPFKSSLITTVDKLVRDMIHDPSVTRYDSMANYSMEAWHKKGVREKRFPTIDPSCIYAKDSGYSRSNASRRVAAALPPRAPALPPRGH